MSNSEELASIPLAEERVAVTKKEVESARTRVRIGVEQREQIVPAELSRDVVEVKRVAMNQPLTELPAVRVEGATTIIPVIEEQLVVEKRLVLVEEIHVVRRSETEVEHVPVVLRAERAEIERLEAGA
jgi:uncharacterized protein (TIGR02271 family)